MTRPHPFDFAFRDIATDVFTALRPEMESPTLGDFGQRQEITDLLDLMVPADSADVDPTIRGGMTQLAYLAYRFVEGGESTVTPDRSALDKAIAANAPVNTGLPADPLYIQLPPQLFWGQIKDTAPHEPVDGVFVALSGDFLYLAAILGFHPDRLGFSQFTTEANQEGWDQAAVHVRNPPFVPMMDGGASMGFYSIVSEAELIRLVQLALHTGRR